MSSMRTKTVSSELELYPHQRRASKQLSNGKILYGGVGTGKSITALQYYVDNESPRDIYILTTAAKRDSLEWEDDAILFKIGKEKSFHGKLHVDSWNRIKEYLDVSGAFFIFDEQRVVGKGAWAKAFLKIAKKNRWILLTATPGDTWSDYVAVFIANGFYRNRTEFNGRHVVFAPYLNFPKIERYLDTAHLNRLRNEVLVKMPARKPTERHIYYEVVQHDPDKMRRVMKDRWNVFKNSPVQNASELFVCLRRVSNDTSWRTDRLGSIFKTRRRLIVFYNFDYELERLRSWLSERDITWGERNGHRHDPVPSGESWVYLVQYASGSEAWNCVETNAMVFYSLNYSYRTLEQAMGRIDRINTPHKDLFYYFLHTDSWIDRSILKANKEKKDFNESSAMLERFGTT